MANFLINSYIFAASGGVFLQDTSISYSGAVRGSAGFRLNWTGPAQTAQGSTLTYADVFTWLVSGSASSYEVRATLSSGDTPSGTLGTWQALSSTRTWELDTGPGGGSVSLTCNLLIEIRDTATSTVQASCTVTISAVRT